MDYRTAVGPPELYDVMGAHQFCVLISEGLRDYHKLLDIGCGSLRGGRLFIPYLSVGNYYGVEPKKNLIHYGVVNELGWDILEVKQPKFYNIGMGDIFRFDTKFDFILAQSVFSHAPKHLIEKCFSSVAQVMKPGGKFLFTFFPSDHDYEGDGWAVVGYTMRWMRQTAKRHGLILTRLDYEHPKKQTWVCAGRGD